MICRKCGGETLSDHIYCPDCYTAYLHWSSDQDFLQDVQMRSLIDDEPDWSISQSQLQQAVDELFDPLNE